MRLGRTWTGNRSGGATGECRRACGRLFGCTVAARGVWGDGIESGGRCKFWCELAYCAGLCLVCTGMNGWRRRVRTRVACGRSHASISARRCTYEQVWPRAGWQTVAVTWCTWVFGNITGCDCRGWDQEQRPAPPCALSCHVKRPTPTPTTHNARAAADVSYTLHTTDIASTSNQNRITHSVLIFMSHKQGVHGG